MIRSFAILFVLALSARAEARLFHNSYLKFELPDNWRCNQEAAAWVCAPANAGDAREALIVSTAKLNGPEDSLNAFENYLRQPKTLVGKDKTSMSQPLSVNRRKIGNQQWVHAVHIGSEVPNFTTRYMATVKQQLAILVSFSADRDVEGKYRAIFGRAIQTLQIDSSKPILMKPVVDPLNDPQAIIGQNAVRQKPQPALPPPAARQKKVWTFGVLAVLAVGVLFAIRKLV